MMKGREVRNGRNLGKKTGEMSPHAGGGGKDEETRKDRRAQKGVSPKRAQVGEP